jgi:hypothetical protein
MEVSHAVAALPRGRSPRYPLDRVGPRQSEHSDDEEKKSLVLPGN